MTDKYAIFLDIDGTLAGRKGVNRKNIEAIKKARELGHYVFANTGRAKSWIEPKLTDGIRFDGIISGLGSLIELDGEPIYENLIPEDIVFKCTEYFTKKSSCFFVSGVNVGFITNPLPFLPVNTLKKFKGIEEFKRIFNSEKIQKIEVFGSIKKEDSAFLAQYLDVYEHSLYCECAIKGCTKAGAIKLVLDRLGIKRENSIAMGDSLNDIDMLKCAGTAVAVGNAVPEVKKIADFISTSCDEGGVGYAIEELLLKK